MSINHSILSVIPTECLNIIKTFNQESRVEIKFIIKRCNTSFKIEVIRYKSGFKLTHSYKNIETQIRHINTNGILYIDTVQDVINYLVIHFFYEPPPWNYEDENEDDDDNTQPIECGFKKMGFRSVKCDNETLLRIFFSRYIPLVGKIFSSP